MIIKNSRIYWIEYMIQMFQTQYNKAQHDINETYAFYRQLIEERKHELIKVKIDLISFCFCMIINLFE